MATKNEVILDVNVDKTVIKIQKETIAILELHIEKLKQENRELLIQFFMFFRDNGEANIGLTIEDFVDLFLKITNK